MGTRISDSGADCSDGEVEDKDPTAEVASLPRRLLHNDVGNAAVNAAVAESTRARIC